jgi:3,4-dihydroxy 2-butanone 4-phosphate synthase/GTP cyclohydrolase II
VKRFPDAAEPADESATPNYRFIGTGAQILRRLNVGKMQLMSAPTRFNALSGFNLEVTDFIQP